MPANTAVQAGRGGCFSFRMYRLYLGGQAIASFLKLPDLDKNPNDSLKLEHKFYK
jgi:hypothetical protein